MNICDSTGEMSLLYQQPRTATVQAEEESALYSLTQKALDDLMDSTPEVKLHIWAEVIGRNKLLEMRSLKVPLILYYFLTESLELQC